MTLERNQTANYRNEPRTPCLARGHCPTRGWCRRGACFARPAQHSRAFGILWRQEWGDWLTNERARHRCVKGPFTRRPQRGAAGACPSERMPPHQDDSLSLDEAGAAGLASGRPRA